MYVELNELTCAGTWHGTQRLVRAPPWLPSSSISSIPNCWQSTNPPLTEGYWQVTLSSHNIRITHTTDVWQIGKGKKKSMWFSSCSPKQIQKHLRELGSQTHVFTLPNLVLDHSAAGNRGRLNRESHKYSLPRGWWWQVMLFILLSLGWWLLERKWFGRRGKRENESTAV